MPNSLLMADGDLSIASEILGGSPEVFETQYKGHPILDYHNDHDAVDKDDVLRRVLPTTISECAAGAMSAGGTCIRDDIVHKMAREYRIADAAPKEAMCALKKATGCTTEECVLNTAGAKVLGERELAIEALGAFKRDGPTNTNLLSNKHIHRVMFTWMLAFEGFWPYNFNMIDYERNHFSNGDAQPGPDTLATVDWGDLYAGKAPPPVDMAGVEKDAYARIAGRAVRCTGCVINNDTYAGDGKHWMALFADARGPEWTVEFFNSAAIPPEKAWVKWMAKTKAEMRRVRPGVVVRDIYACRVWHQHTKTECGVYALFYIWARLNGVPADYFLEHAVPDQFMFEFRQHLFRGDGSGTQAPFDFAAFAGENKIKWDTENLSAGRRPF